eukprot:TRINITY_DN580_c0_g1_i1.p1 TRINITY_DN580_c0_g1~~TRINITY_DN580_c0_g1_i1.p1  ORF type:complete len:700 (-),score=165.19 TRINITY_DN580_c0_g1_i1:42-2141(-)
MSVPLSVRKNIRDAQPKCDEALQKINDATGKEGWTCEVDWPTVVPQLSDSDKNRIGTIYFDDAMEYLARNLVRTCKIETSKEAISEATNNNKIVIRPNAKLKSNWTVAFANGDIVVEHLPNISSVSTLEYLDLVALVPTEGLPLSVRLNLENNNKRKDEELEIIGTATGHEEWIIEADFDSIIPKLAKSDQDRIGNIYYDDALCYLARNIKRTLQNETIKEAFNEATNEHKITFQLNDKIAQPWTISIKDGGLIIQHKVAISSISTLEYFDLPTIIPSPGLPIPVRVNIESHKKQHDENIETINTATGVEDWTTEIDFDTIVPQLEKSEALRIGAIYYDDALCYIARNIKRNCANETTKEAFLEGVQDHKIIIRLNPKIKSPWTVKIENNCLVLEHLKAISSVSTLEYFDLPSIIPSPGGLPLTVRLNIEANKKSYDDNMEIIHTATGSEEFIVEIPFDTIVPQLAPSEANRIGNLMYDDALCYLARNLKRVLADESVKEAFLEAVSEKKVIINIINDAKAPNWSMKFKDGALHILGKKEMNSISQIEYLDTIGLMPVPGVLSLEAKLNIAKNQERKAEELEKVAKATGNEYLLDDSVWEDIYPKIEPSDQKRIGNLVIDDALCYLTRNIVRRCADEMVKEAFDEITSARTIVFKLDKDPKSKQKEAWIIEFKDGVVVCTGKAMASLSTLEYFDFEKLL